MIKALNEHKGRDNPITMTQLYVAITGYHIVPNIRIDQTRIIRSLAKEIRRDGLPLAFRGGSKFGGYYLAETDEELEGTIRSFHIRAMSGLKQEAALKRISFDELFEQYKLELKKNQQEDS